MSDKLVSEESVASSVASLAAEGPDGSSSDGESVAAEDERRPDGSSSDGESVAAEDERRSSSDSESAFAYRAASPVLQTDPPESEAVLVTKLMAAFADLGGTIRRACKLASSIDPKPNAAAAAAAAGSNATPADFGPKCESTSECKLKTKVQGAAAAKIITKCKSLVRSETADEDQTPKISQESRRLAVVILDKLCGDDDTEAPSSSSSSSSTNNTNEHADTKHENSAADEATPPEPLYESRRMVEVVGPTKRSDGSLVAQYIGINRQNQGTHGTIVTRPMRTTALLEASSVTQQMRDIDDYATDEVSEIEAQFADLATIKDKRAVDDLALRLYERLHTLLEWLLQMRDDAGLNLLQGSALDDSLLGPRVPERQHWSYRDPMKLMYWQPRKCKLCNEFERGRDFVLMPNCGHNPCLRCFCESRARCPECRSWSVCVSVMVRYGHNDYRVLPVHSDALMRDEMRL